MFLKYLLRTCERLNNRFNRCLLSVYETIISRLNKVSSFIVIFCRLAWGFKYKFVKFCIKSLTKSAWNLFENLRWILVYVFLLWNGGMLKALFSGNWALFTKNVSSFSVAAHVRSFLKSHVIGATSMPVRLNLNF